MPKNPISVAKAIFKRKRWPSSRFTGFPDEFPSKIRNHLPFANAGNEMLILFYPQPELWWFVSDRLVRFNQGRKVTDMPLLANGYC